MHKFWNKKNKILAEKSLKLSHYSIFNCIVCVFNVLCSAKEGANRALQALRIPLDVSLSFWLLSSLSTAVVALD